VPSPFRALGPGVLDAGEGAGTDAGLGLEHLGSLAGQGGAPHLVTGFFVRGGDGARGGRLAGAGAADDLREIVRGRRMEDGGARLGR